MKHTGIVTEYEKRTIEFNWSYRRQWVMNRAGKLSWLFCQAIRVYKFKIGFKGLTWVLGDRKVISFAYEGLEIKDVQVRGAKWKGGSHITRCSMRRG